MLDSCLEVADRLAAFCWQLGAQGILPHAGDNAASFKSYADDIKTHQRNIAVILQSLDGTINIVSFQRYMCTEKKSDAFLLIAVQNFRVPQQSNSSHNQ